MFTDSNLFRGHLSQNGTPLFIIAPPLSFAGCVKRCLKCFCLFPTASNYFWMFRKWVQIDVPFHFALSLPHPHSRPQWGFYLFIYLSFYLFIPSSVLLVWLLHQGFKPPALAAIRCFFFSFSGDWFDSTDKTFLQTFSGDAVSVFLAAAATQHIWDCSLNANQSKDVRVTTTESPPLKSL